MPSRSCRQCIGLGILVSALVHGLGLALLLGRQPPLPAGGQETGLELELDLALFAPVSGSETPVARLPGSTPSTRESAAGAQGLPEPGPEPVTTAMSGLEAKTDILSEPEPEPEPEPEADQNPKAEPEPEPVVEQNPEAEPEPEPRVITKAEPASETDFESQPEPADIPKAEPASEPSPAAVTRTVAPSPRTSPPEVARPRAPSQPSPKPRVVKKTEAGKKAQATRVESPSLTANTLSPPPGISSPPPGTASAPAPAPSAPPSASQGGHAGPLGAATTGDEAYSAAARARAEGGYLAELQRAIKRHQRYPDQARSEGREGSTTLTFVLLADGSFEEVKVARTSGDRELDRAAIEALKRLNRFRPIPLEFGRRRWPLSVSIRFDLR